MVARQVKAKRKWVEESKATGVPITCALCLNPISLGGDKMLGHLTADHIITKESGGSEAFDNLQPAHQWCNHRRMEHTMEWVAENRHVFQNPLRGHRWYVGQSKKLKYKADAKGLTGKERQEYIKSKRLELVSQMKEYL